MKIVSDPNLSKYERETHIYMNDDEKMAYIDTAQVPWMKYLKNYKPFKCDKDGITMIDEVRIVGMKGKIPKNCVRASKDPRQRFDKL